MHSTSVSRDSLYQPEIGEDLVRVHRAITRAVDVSLQYSLRYLDDGFPDNRIKKGYLTYTYCLEKLLHAHHVTEDNSMFPYLRKRITNAPYKVLTTQHKAMGPVLDEIRAALRQTKGVNSGSSLTMLSKALNRIHTLWHEHIYVEEAAFGPDAISSLLTKEERREAAKITARHAAQHQFPLSLMIPFLLYNMLPEDREIMLKLMPVFIPLLINVWKPRWQIMAPFLLLGAQ